VLANRLPVFDAANEKPVRYMACLVNVEGQLAALPKPQPPADSFGFDRVQDWRVLADVISAGGVDPLVTGGLSRQGVVLPGTAIPMAAAAAQGPLSGGVVSSRPPLGGALDGGTKIVAAPVASEWTQVTAKVAAAASDPDAKRLVRDTMGLGFRLPIGAYALEKVYRFPVLAHWSFTTNEGATFETLMQDLDVGLLGSLPVEAEAEPGRPEPPPVPDDGPEVLATGHLGLSHRTRRGDAVRAWYRGPCAPFPTPRDGEKTSDPLPLAHAADQLRRVIPDGREDLTLAAAFEIGRLLAVSQLSVVSALLRFRAEQFGAGRVRELLTEVLAFELPAYAPGMRADTVALGRFVATQVVGEMAGDPARVLGPRRPIADPGRELRIKGSLDEIVASGLGIDLTQVRELAAAVGVLAALEATSVPLAGTLGSAKLTEQGLTSLHAALTTELERTLSVAVKPTTTVGVKPTTTVGVLREGRRAPDALDALIERAPAEEEEESP
jgi:hypothetical protein